MAGECAEITLTGDALDRMRSSDFAELAELQNRIALGRVALEAAREEWARASQRAAMAAANDKLKYDLAQASRRQAQQAAAALEDARLDLQKLLVQRWAALSMFAAPVDGRGDETGGDEHD